jgi:hypothetical protein
VRPSPPDRPRASVKRAIHQRFIGRTVSRRSVLTGRGPGEEPHLQRCALRRCWRGA